MEEIYEQNKRRQSKSHFLRHFFSLNFLLSIFFLDPYHYPNATSRALPIVSLINHGTWKLDAYYRWTIDISRVGNHYYTDKAPLSTLVTLPFAYLWHQVSSFIQQPEDRQIATVIKIGGLITGTGSFLGLLWLLLCGLQTRYPMNIAGPLAMLILYGSNLFIFAGAFWGHLLAGLLLSLTFRAYQQQQYWASGLLLGLGTCTEYPLGFLFLFFTIGILLRTTLALRKCLAFLVSGSMPLALLGFYHWLFTGHPLRPLYFYVATKEFIQMRTNLGFSWPDLTVLFQLLFGVFRGSLVYTPLLILLMIFIGLDYKKINWPQFWQKYWLVVSTICYFLLVNSSYFVWDGGWCHGPRHLVPALALLLVVFACSFPLNPYQIKMVMIVSGVGIFLNWMTKVVYPIYSSDIRFPYFQYIIPNFIHGKFSATDLFNQWSGTANFLFPCLWPILLLLVLLIVSWMGKKFHGTLSPL